MNDAKYIGLDVHQATISATVLDSAGKLVMNLRKRKTHSVSFHGWGWTVRPFPLRFAVAGEAFVLTSPFIERDYRNVVQKERGRFLWPKSLAETYS
jgi:hypothetical protein